MNSRNQKHPVRTSQINSVAQRKTAVPSQNVGRPVAPPVYRPQPVPKVLQAKMVSPRPAPPVMQRKVVAPPVYRPQAPPKVLQLKKPACVSPRPPVAQKLPTPRVLQPMRKPGPVTPQAHASKSPAPPAVARNNHRLPIMQMKSARGISAQAARRLIQMKHDRKATKFSEKDLQKAAHATVTALLYIDANGDDNWECHGKFTNDKDGHAEEQLLSYLNDEVYCGEDGDGKVVIELTTSPCGPAYKNCAGKLKKFMEDDASSRGIANVKIKTLGFYKGAKDAMYDAAELKSVEGMDIEVWDLMGEMRGGKTEEGYDNSDSLQAIAAAHLYQDGRTVKALDKSEYNKEKFGKFVLDGE